MWCSKRAVQAMFILLKTNLSSFPMWFQMKETVTTPLAGDSHPGFQAHMPSRFNTVQTEISTPMWQSSKMEWHKFYVWRSLWRDALLCRGTCGCKRTSKSGYKPPGRAIFMTMFIGWTPSVACVYINRNDSALLGGLTNNTIIKFPFKRNGLPCFENAKTFPLLCVHTRSYWQ